MDKKARMKGSTKLILWLIVIYLGLGVLHHFQTNSNDWTNDLLMGGFQQLKLWFKF